jgi:spermidine/putrescine transport system substrate-binding protein
MASRKDNIALSLYRRVLDKALIALFFLFVLLFFLYMPTVLRLVEEEKSINVYMFTEFVSPEAIRDFEKESGVKVYVQYYESNEELYAKFKINEGVGYDLITPSDYMIELLKNDGLLQKIDSKKISHFAQLDQRMLHHYFDPRNEYSMPLTWSVYGVVYDKLLLTVPETAIGFDFIFKNPYDLFRLGLVKKPYRVCMFDDPREVFLIASLYLFSRIKGLSERDIAAVESLLVDHKQWVECYTNFGLRYFLEGNIISCAATSSRYVPRILDSAGSRFGFKIPNAGSLLVIENFAIPVHSKKTEYVHRFIDFMLSRKYCTFHFEEYGGGPVNSESYQDIDQKYFKDLQFFPSDELFSKLFLIHNELPIKKIEEMWLRVKTA